MQTGTRDEIVFQRKSSFVNDFLGNKGFLSYLNITKIENYVTPPSNEIASETINFCVKSNDQLIVGIRMCLENGVSSICVRDENKNMIGQFELSSLSKLKF